MCRKNGDYMAERNCFNCKNEYDIALCARCEDGSEYIIKTNADRIRSMTDEELAEWIGNITDCCYGNYCDGCPFNENGCNKEKLIKWLQKECEV